MVVLKSPLTSQSASGTLADVLTFRNLRSKHVAGVKSNPKQPRTLAQRATRIWMTWLSKQWSTLSYDQQHTWLNYTDTPLLSAYHAYIRYNTKRWITQPGSRHYPDYFHFAPSIQYPAAENTPTTNIQNRTSGGGPGFIWHKFETIYNTDCWLFAYHLSTIAHPNPVAGNLVHVETVDHDGWFDLKIRNLPPGATKLYWLVSSGTGIPYHWYRELNETVT